MKSKNDKVYDVLIIGGGFYGCILALYLKKSANSVILIEKEKDLLLKASYNNQARVHNGYHYPRSFITALRSHANYMRFLKDFKKSIYKDFNQYYAVAANFSKTTSRQFVKFCNQLGSPIKQAPETIRKLFNNRLIEDVFEVEECVFDAGVLRKILREKLKEENIKVLYKTEIYKVKQKDGMVECFASGGKKITGKNVFNCTYSQINKLLAKSNLSLLPLKHEFIEMPLIKTPDPFSNMAVTILDGPFFGFLPFPDQKLHSFWHVRYAVHANWTDPIEGNIKKVLNKLSQKSNFNFMIKDAQRYVPLLSESKYKGSIFETKTILVSRESSDGRPVLFRKNYGISGFHVVMGGKVDNIYDVIEEIRKNPVKFH
ncbi:MAG: FAD-dependent oxidoreductase [Patescibacteria group bacterium]